MHILVTNERERHGDMKLSGFFWSSLTEFMFPHDPLNSYREHRDVISCTDN